jgi:hypothetical protein
MASTCDVAPENHIPCSGNGVCNNSVCMCNAFYTGQSDWVNAQGKDCQIFLPVIWGFWGLNIVEILICLYLALPILTRLFRHHQHVKEVQKQKGMNYSIRDNLGLFSVLPYWCIALPTHAALAVFKLVERDAQLGTSLGVTILWMLSRISADLSNSSARAALSLSTMQSEGASKGKIRRREILISVMFILSAGASFLIWPVYATGGTDLVVDEALFATHFIFLSFVTVFNATISHILGNSVYYSLTESYEKLKDSRIVDVRDQLVSAQKVERNFSIFIALSYLALGAVPALWTTYNYFWCTLWLAGPYLGLKSVIALDAAQKSARGEKVRDKLIDSLRVSSGAARRRESVTAPQRLLYVRDHFPRPWAGLSLMKSTTDMFSG